MKTIYLAVKNWFPKHTNIWMTGHSLGGALACLVALTNELPCVAFESPGDLLYASRLGLLPTLEPDALDEYLRRQRIYHFGNTGDPVFLGQCTGITSSCYWMDYALESQCHIGYECVYDHTAFNSEILDGYRFESQSQQVLSHPHDLASIQYHSIDYVIKNFIATQSVPECKFRSNCFSSECQKWDFVE